jgi:hypothetical protein
VYMNRYEKGEFLEDSVTEKKFLSQTEVAKRSCCHVEKLLLSR